MPWLSWIDRTELPPVVISIITCLLFLPFYNFGAMAPQQPFQGTAFPVAFALALMFLIRLTCGASGDLRLLILADKIDTSYRESIGSSKRIALVQLAVCLVHGLQRVQVLGQL